LQLRLLLGETAETASPMVGAEPFPYVGGVFAARAVAVLADPTHFMFGKLNQFLLKRPNWTVENLPRYFGKIIINSEPDQDGFYHKEVDWYLDYLIDCLRTPKDMEIFRTRNVFERLLSYYASASCAIPAKEKIARLLLRAVAVGGSTALITRCGLVSWIHMRLQSNDHRHVLLRQLASRALEACDQEKVAGWSRTTAEKAMGGIVQAAA
jgi:nucleolar pre-ribosomal-associated protein 1